MYHDGIITMADISRQTNIGSLATILSTFPFYIWWRGWKDPWWLSKDNRGEIQKENFSEEMIEVTSTWRILPFYRWRKSQTDSNWNLRSTKSRITSQKFWLAKEVQYQLLFPHDLYNHSTRIWKDASYQFREARSTSTPALSQQCNLLFNPKDLH